MPDMPDLQKLYEAVVDGDAKTARDLTEQALAAKANRPLEFFPLARARGPRRTGW